jgi:hypothetical protein
MEHDFGKFRERRIGAAASGIVATGQQSGFTQKPHLFVRQGTGRIAFSGANREGFCKTAGGGHEVLPPSV